MEKKMSKSMKAKERALLDLVDIMEQMELDRIKGFRKKKKGMEEVMQADKSPMCEDDSEMDDEEDEEELED